MAEGLLLAEDLARELGAPPEWVEEARCHLPHHVKVRDGSWFVLVEDLHIWAAAWELASKRVAA